MKLRFTKMQGLGNDFVVIDGIRQRVDLTAEQIRRLADRRFGIGCDQVLIVEKPRSENVDFYYRIYNADGHEVEQCGNGARCFVKFVRAQGLTELTQIRVATACGTITPRLESDGTVTVDMGVPRFALADIPCNVKVAKRLLEAPLSRVSGRGAGGEGSADSESLLQELTIGKQVITVAVLSMGNPHAVQTVPDIDAAPVTTQGPLIENHPLFPQRVNAGYMQIIDPHTIKLRVWERGAGETLACGTGACAATVAGIRQVLLESPVRVEMRGGALTIAWAGMGQPVMMTGPAETVFEGEWEIQE